MRYRALFDAVPDPVSILAEDGTVLDLNKAGMAAYKRPREEIVGQNINVLNPELPHDHMDPVWESLNRGDSYVIEVTNMRGDGTRFPVEVHSANFVFDGRKSLVAVARDLSKRHEAELRYRELMEVIDKGIVVQNQAREIVYANRAAMRIFGVGEGKRTNDLNLEHWRIVDQNGHEMTSDALPAHRALATGQVIESMLLGLYHRRAQAVALAYGHLGAAVRAGRQQARAGHFSFQRRHRAQARQRAVRSCPVVGAYRRMGMGCRPRPGST